MTPTPKVAAGAIGAALSIILVFVMTQFGIVLPPEVAQAVTLLVSFAAGWLKSERKGQHAA
jgi:hypothetical protein